ncbi:MAG TPA: DUF885 domain-containing protein [Pseudonocardiaceae bacterium]|nr:DUF885 domain-containing protein [Pseudonocardiaceae bacterium]
MADTVTTLADELVTVQLDAIPLGASVLGLGTHPDRLDDLSEAAAAEQRIRYADIAARADAVPDTGLSDRERITKALIKHEAASGIDLIDAAQIEFAVSDSFVSPAGDLLLSMPATSIDTPELAEGYLARLAAVPEYLVAAANRHRAGTESGRTMVRRLAEAALRYLTDDAADQLRREPADATARFLARQEELISSTVRPALAAYRAAIADLLARARTDEQPGVCWLPDGEATYTRLARVHTTTDRTAQDLHDTGIAIIEGLDEEYRELGSRVFGTTDLRAIFTHLSEDLSLRWESPQQVLDTARTALARATEAAPRWFGVVAEEPCLVRPTPPGTASSALPMYYMAPALDGSRPGTYFANTENVTERSRTIAEVTAFHEGVPGHHFQFALLGDQADVPVLHKIANANAYVEGWGLYSERLADEMGLYSDDVARLGMLVYDSMRAGRLVVDTGMHALGWSRQRAVDFLRTRTPMTISEINTEIDRYIGYPGQALAYMVGRLEIQRLRAHATAVLGDRFDLRGFHDAVLGSGRLPLAVLDTVIEEWIAVSGH